MVSGFLVSMSQTAVQVALPQIMTVFGLNLEQAQWIVTAYVIAGVCWCRRSAGSATFLGTVRSTCWVCPSCGPTRPCVPSPGVARPHHLPFSRALAAAPSQPMTMMFMSNVFPPRAAGHSHGDIWHGTDRWSHCRYRHWGLYHGVPRYRRMVFFLNFVPGVICIVLVLLILPNVREEVQYTLDLANLLTMGIFLVSPLVALSQGQREGWDAPFIQRLFVVAGVAFVTFIACELLATFAD